MREWQVDLITQVHCIAGRSVFQLCPHAGLHLRGVILVLCLGYIMDFNALESIYLK